MDEEQTTKTETLAQEAKQRDNLFVTQIGAMYYRLFERLERFQYIPGVRKHQLTISHRRPEEGLAEVTYELEIIVGAGAQQFKYTEHSVDDIYKKMLEAIRLLRPRYEDCIDSQKQMLHDQL